MYPTFETLLNSTKGLTTLLQLKRKAEFHASTQDKAWLSSWNSVGTLRSLWQLETYPEFPASTQDEALFPWSDSRGIPRCPSQLERRLDFPEATWEVPWRPRHNWRGTQSFLPQFKKHHEIPPSMQDEARFPAVTWDQSHAPLVTRKENWLPWGNMRGSLRLPSQLKRNPKLPATARDKPRDSSLSARWSPFTLQRLESNTEFQLETRKEAWLLYANQEVPQDTCHNLIGTPSSLPQSREEHRVPHLISRWGQIPLHCLESNPEFSFKTRKEAWLPLCNSKVPGSSPSWIQGIRSVDSEAREVYKYRFIDLERYIAIRKQLRK